MLDEKELQEIEERLDKHFDSDGFKLVAEVRRLKGIEKWHRRDYEALCKEQDEVKRLTEVNSQLHKNYTKRMEKYHYLEKKFARLEKQNQRYKQAIEDSESIASIYDLEESIALKGEEEWKK
jgi:uncharacterized protein (DUF3084 family)